MTPAEKVLGVALLPILLLTVWTQFFDRPLQHRLAYRIALRAVFDLLFAMQYALAALFLSYGELRPVAESKQSG